MKIYNSSKIERLLSALGNTEQNQANSQAVTSNSKALPKDAEAVRVADNFGMKAEESKGSREERVAELKAQVEGGTYKPASTAVAAALAKDLLV